MSKKENMKKENIPKVMLLSEIGMPAHIDSREHTEIMKRYIFIVEKFQKYIDDFIEGLKKEPLPPKYRFSSLTYYRGWLLKGK